eukprot:COSAG02_NODE_63089_length_264_cov_0.624242_1_plen_23_part_10
MPLKLGVNEPSCVSDVIPAAATV